MRFTEEKLERADVMVNDKLLMINEMVANDINH